MEDDDEDTDDASEESDMGLRRLGSSRPVELALELGVVAPLLLQEDDAPAATADEEEEGREFAALVAAAERDGIAAAAEA